MNKYINALKKVLAQKSYIQTINIAPTSKVISFTFDDAPKSAFTQAQKILDKNNLNATYYIALSFLDSNTDNDNLYTLEDLKNCLANGHELACHTYNHVHFYQISSSKIVESEISRNQQAFDKLGFNSQFKNFSFPFGEQTRTAKKTVSKKFKTCRGIDYGINRGLTDKANLKAVRLYEAQNPINKIYSILEDFDKSGGWLIFYTHDVTEKYSQYGCSPDYFEKAITKCLGLGIEIGTIEQCFKRFA